MWLHQLRRVACFMTKYINLYTISKFEFPTINIVDFMSAQSWAILPSKMAFKSRGHVKTSRDINAWRQFVC